MKKQIGNYIIEKTLGSGITGKVKLATNIQTEKPVAIKIIEKTILQNNPSLLKKIQREIALMRLIDHPNILGLIDVIESDKNIFIVEQYASEGALFDIIQSLNLFQAFSFFRQIIYGLEYMHNHGICHRDLKPENILLDYSNQILIADFGFACWMPDNIAKTSCGSPHYAAPEIIKGTQYNGCLADVWSSGVILYAMLTGFLPFNDESARTTLKKIKKGDYTIPDNLDSNIKDLIGRILNVDPLKRLTIEQIKQHPATRIGLPITYILPTPFPIPQLFEPIVLDSTSESTLNYLEQIGFHDREALKNLLRSTSSNMAKVFYIMLTKPFDPDILPWGEQIRQKDIDDSLVFEHPFLFPMDYDAPYSDPLTDIMIENDFPSTPTSPNGSLAGSNPSNIYKPEWLPAPAPIIYEQEQNITDLVMPMASLMLILQNYFTENDYNWFHPNDRTIVIQYSTLPIYATLQGIYNRKGQGIILSVKMNRGTADDFFTFFEIIRNILRPEIKTFSDKELDDFHTLDHINTDIAVGDSPADQNCAPM